jgi:hypothetical protein
MPFQSLSKQTKSSTKVNDQSSSTAKSETPVPFSSTENILMMQGLVGNQANNLKCGKSGGIELGVSISQYIHEYKLISNLITSGYSVD